MPNLSPNNTVSKSNYLIEASYSLSLDEQRLVLACISKIKPHTDINKYDKFTITAVEFGKTFGLTNKNAYRELENATFSLYDRDIRFKHNDGSKERIRWVYSIKYHSGKGYVTLGFSPDVIPHMAMLKNQFTTYQLQQVSGFKKVYAIRIYEMLMRWRATGEVYITPEALRLALNIADKYPSWSEFRRRVINPALAEINMKSNTTATYATEKTGRNITKIYFYFDTPKQRDMFK